MFENLVAAPLIHWVLCIGLSPITVTEGHGPLRHCSVVCCAACSTTLYRMPSERVAFAVCTQVFFRQDAVAPVGRPRFFNTLLQPVPHRRPGQQPAAILPQGAGHVAQRVNTLAKRCVPYTADASFLGLLGMAHPAWWLSSHYDQVPGLTWHLRAPASFVFILLTAGLCDGGTSFRVRSCRMK